MRIGLIDVDGHDFPSLPLMKLSSWHKSRGDSVEWYRPMTSGHMDRVYLSKVFSFSPDYLYYIDADEVIRGGSGYAIRLVDGLEVYDKDADKPLPYEIEHAYPDYSLYGITDTAYGFLTRGCPRGCDFCHVEAKEGGRSVKVADLSEFWRGQKNIVLCDPNLIACTEWRDLLRQLADSKAWVDINQGVDIRMMTEEKAEALSRLKLKSLHFAWDRYEDKEKILPKLRMFKDVTGIDYRKLVVYVLVNFNSTHEQDLERIYAIRDLGYSPYVMIYDREHTKPSDTVRRLQRYVNNNRIFRTIKRFEEYK